MLDSVTAVKVQLLGRLVIDVDGAHADIAHLGGLGRTAFAYLLLERRRPVPRDELADVLWGEDLPPTWTSALRGVLSRLRAALATVGLPPGEVLRSQFGCYQLLLPDDVQIDVEEVVRVVESAPQDPDMAPAEVRQALARAVDLASRQFLPGAGGTWVEGRQSELADQRVRALELLLY